MSDTYTYRGGVKLPLNKRPDQFVVRAQPVEMLPLGVTDAERVSAGSIRVTTRADELEPMMARSRLIAPTHHAYELPATGEEFLITDRVLVSFKQALPAERIAEIAGRYGLRQVEAYSDRDFLPVPAKTSRKKTARKAGTPGPQRKKPARPTRARR